MHLSVICHGLCVLYLYTGTITIGTSIKNIRHQRKGTIYLPVTALTCIIATEILLTDRKVSEVLINFVASISQSLKRFNFKYLSIVDCFMNRLSKLFLNHSLFIHRTIHPRILCQH